jgi:CBS domain-containing protein
MNQISNRVAEFLSQFPPFNLATAAELAALSEVVVIQYREAGEILFLQDQKPGDYFYVVRQGSVKVFYAGAEEELVDICDEGDIFGVRPVLANETYLASAKTLEECLIYAIPVSAGKHILEQNPKVALFFAMGYASGKPMQRFHNRGNIPQKSQIADALPLLSEAVLVDGKRSVLTCPPTTPIAQAARFMAEKNVGSIIITTDKKPLGIVTDKDLRNHVATGKTALSEPISAIMSSPVFCLKPGLSVADCMLEMMSHNVHHLCITADGTAQTVVLGIISDHDLLLEQGFNPAILIKEMRKTAEIPQLLNLRAKADDLLQKYLEQEVSMSYISRMMAAVNSALLHRIVTLSIEKLGAPPCPFAWLALGSQGREEQLLRTDQDHALVFADAETAEENTKRQRYFLQLANEVVQELERFGFAQDVADIGANHIKWCQPLSVWKQYFTDWVSKPDEENILRSTIFFDFRAAYGEEKVASELAEHLYQQLPKTQIFLPLLAKNAMANPAPLSFFRNFMVEASGEHKHEFDQKLRAMLPLVDAARVLILHHKISGINNTVGRYRKLAELEPNNRELMEEAAEGYALLMELRARFGLKNKNSGRYLNPNELGKMQRQALRNIFATITDLQSLLKVRFQTNYLG